MQNNNNTNCILINIKYRKTATHNLQKQLQPRTKLAETNQKRVHISSLLGMETHSALQKCFPSSPPSLNVVLKV